MISKRKLSLPMIITITTTIPVQAGNKKKKKRRKKKKQTAKERQPPRIPNQHHQHHPQVIKRRNQFLNGSPLERKHKYDRIGYDMIYTKLNRKIAIYLSRDK